MTDEEPQPDPEQKRKVVAVLRAAERIIRSSATHIAADWATEKKMRRCAEIINDLCVYLGEDDEMPKNQLRLA